MVKFRVRDDIEMLASLWQPVVIYIIILFLIVVHNTPNLFWGIPGQHYLLDEILSVVECNWDTGSRSCQLVLGCSVWYALGSKYFIISYHCQSITMILRINCPFLTPCNWQPYNKYRYLKPKLILDNLHPHYRHLRKQALGFIVELRVLFARPSPSVVAKVECGGFTLVERISSPYFLQLRSEPSRSAKYRYPGLRKDTDFRYVRNASFQADKVQVQRLVEDVKAQVKGVTHPTSRDVWAL